MSEDFKAWADFFGDPEIWNREFVKGDDLIRVPETEAWKRYRKAIMKAYGIKDLGEKSHDPL